MTKRQPKSSIANSVISNVKTVSYSELDEKVDKILKDAGQKNFKLTFSMFESVENSDDHEDWKVRIPDFDSDEHVFNGKCIFYEDFWSGHMSRIINNPTWEDILVEANHAASGDHIFWESINYEKTVKGVKYYIFHFGS